MNQFVKEHFEVFRATQALFSQLMDAITDADLAYTPGGDAATLGELIKEQGEIEYAYLESFRAFTQDFSYRNDTPGLATSTAALQTWIESVRADLNSAIEAFTDADLFGKVVERGGGFSPPVGVQAHIYREALLIFYGKASVYLKALGKTMPQHWIDWIG